MDLNAPDIADLDHQLAHAQQDAQALVAGLSEELAAWRLAVNLWSIAECLDHIATANRVYLAAMTEPAIRARQQRRLRRGPATPGLLGGWFVRTLEPPVKPTTRMKAPRKIAPRVAPPLSDAVAALVASQNDVRVFLAACADLDLHSVRFPNPFIGGLRFSLATGLNVIAAHQRRHLWQAWRIRRAAENAAP